MMRSIRDRVRVDRFFMERLAPSRMNISGRSPDRIFLSDISKCVRTRSPTRKNGTTEGNAAVLAREAHPVRKHEQHAVPRAEFFQQWSSEFDCVQRGFRKINRDKNVADSQTFSRRASRRARGVDLLRR